MKMIGRTVTEELKRRSGVRTGLAGVAMKHVPTGREFTCTGSTWAKDGALMVETCSGDRLPASECILMSEWEAPPSMRWLSGRGRRR